MTVNSVPQGDDVNLDGVPVGTTTKIVQVTPGKHLLTFSKKGLNTVNLPLETTPNDVPGGSVSYELKTSIHDTVELRDGSVLIGDVESMSGHPNCRPHRRSRFSATRHRSDLPTSLFVPRHLNGKPSPRDLYFSLTTL